jgi:hypothetical protein
MPRRHPTKTLTILAVGIMAGLAAPIAPADADAASTSGGRVQLAQYYPYGPPPPYYRGAPPCNAVNNPWGGAARGAAAGAIFGGIAGDAGTGAAVGAGLGLLRRGIQNSNARANGYCY